MASLLDGVRAVHDQRPGYGLACVTGARCSSGPAVVGPGTGRKVELRAEAAFDLLVVLDRERGGSEMRRAGMLAEPDAKSLATVVPDKQGRVNVPLQPFFRHPALQDLTTAARAYVIVDLHLGVVHWRDEQGRCPRPRSGSPCSSR